MLRKMRLFVLFYLCENWDFYVPSSDSMIDFNYFLLLNSLLLELDVLEPFCFVERHYGSAVRNTSSKDFKIEF